MLINRELCEETDIWYNDGADLPDLQLFGYYFHPTAQYIAAGEFSKKAHGICRTLHRTPDPP